MKHLFYFLALSSLLIFSVGCGSDDDGPTCTQAEFLGTYSGTETCAGTGEATRDYTITAGATANSLVVTDDIGQVYDVTIDGCGFSWGTIVLGTGSKGNGSIDGNTFTLRRETEALGSTVFDCTFTGTK